MKIKEFTTGVQHIGIPTNNINKTIEFYHALGFETALRTVNGTEEVAFLQLHNLIIETYQRTIRQRWNMEPSTTSPSM